MTPWRLEQLWQAYRVTHQEMVRELETERIQDVPTERRRSLWIPEGFPVRYLRTHSASEIEAHLELDEMSRASPA